MPILNFVVSANLHFSRFHGNKWDDNGSRCHHIRTHTECRLDILLETSPQDRKQDTSCQKHCESNESYEIAVPTLFIVDTPSLRRITNPALQLTADALRQLIQYRDIMLTNARRVREKMRKDIRKNWRSSCQWAGRATAVLCLGRGHDVGFRRYAFANALAAVSVVAYFDAAAYEEFEFDKIDSLNLL